jgi:hypothetical protein
MKNAEGYFHTVQSFSTVLELKFIVYIIYLHEKKIMKMRVSQVKNKKIEGWRFNEVFIKIRERDCLMGIFKHGIRAAVTFFIISMKMC